MAVTLYQDTLPFSVAGYELFEGLDGSGQLNIWEPIRTDLDPFLTTLQNSGEFTAYYSVKGYLAAEVEIVEPSYISRLQGYPSRYNLGSVIYLQSNRAIGQLKYVNYLQWADEWPTRFWVGAADPDPYFFPPSIAPPAIGLSGLFPVYDIRSNSTLQGTIPCDGFAFDWNPGVIAKVAFIWYAAALRVPVSELPSGYYLYQM